MKKIIFISFLFFTIFMCYFIYNITEKKELNILTIGDINADNPYIKKEKNVTKYNNIFINKDYRIIDVLNIIKYNQEKAIDNKTISIHRLLKESNIVIISIGMNDIYYKLNDDTKNIYTYINNMVNDMELIFNEIDRYNHNEVIVLGYYNITNENNDIFTYLNYKMKQISNKHHFTYLELNNILKNNSIYLKESTNFYLNNYGYQEINKLIVEKIKKY